MKRFFLTLVCLVLTVSTAMAHPISLNDAARYASYLADRLQRTVVKVVPGDNYYYAELAPEGYFVLSTDSEMPPVKFFSLKGKFEKDSPFGRFLVENLYRTTSKISEKLLTSAKYQEAWFYLDLPKAGLFAGASEKQPLLQTHWGQSGPYSSATPVVNGQHSPPGCLAVALGQIMKYYSFPSEGRGSITYTDQSTQRSANFNHPIDWTKIPNSLDNATEEETEALSTLLRDVGYAVETKYRSDVSISTVAYALHGANKYYKFSKDGEIVSSAFMDLDSFESTLKDDLLRNHPSLATLALKDSDIGHAVVFDGFKTIDNVSYFHINAGLSGEGDGWYALNSFDLNAFGTTYSVDPEQIWATTHLKPGQPDEPAWENYYPEVFSPAEITEANGTVTDINVKHQFSSSKAPGAIILLHKWTPSDRVFLKTYKDGTQIDSTEIAGLTQGSYDFSTEDFFVTPIFENLQQDGNYRLALESNGTVLKETSFTIGASGGTHDDNSTDDNGTDGNGTDDSSGNPQNLTRKLGETTYYAVAAKKTWLEAESYCLAKGGHLAKIDSSSENGFVLNLARDAHLDSESDSIWLGLSDYNQDGNWTWTAGESSYTNWKSGEPNGAQDENFAVMLLKDTPGKWSDICKEPECQQLPFVCEVLPEDNSTQDNSGSQSNEDNSESDNKGVEVTGVAHATVEDQIMIVTVPDLVYQGTLVAENVKLVQKTAGELFFQIEDFVLKNGEKTKGTAAKIEKLGHWSIFIPSVEEDGKTIAENVVLRLEKVGLWKVVSYDQEEVSQE